MMGMGPGAQMTGGGLPPGMTLPMRRKALVLAGILSTMFLAALDQTIVTVSMPAIAQDLDGLDLFVWPVTSYLLASSALVPVVGKLSDVYGRKPFILVGIVVFVIGSWLCGAAGDMIWLIAFRAIQGVGAGLIMTTAFTSVGDLFSPKDRGRWIGLFAATFGLASIVGPLVGGALTDHLSWRWIFYVNIPVAMVALALVSFGMPWFRGQGKAIIDWLGGGADCRHGRVAAAGPFLGRQPVRLGRSAGRRLAWERRAGFLLVLFLLQTRRAKEPVLLPWALPQPRLHGLDPGDDGAWSGHVRGLPVPAASSSRASRRSSATNTGLILMPMTGGMVFGSVTSGQLLSRGRDLRLMAIMGGAALLTAFYLLSTLEQASAAWTTRGYMVLLGVGMGFWMPTFQLAVQNALPHRFLGTWDGLGQLLPPDRRHLLGRNPGLADGELPSSRTWRTRCQPQFGELLSDPQRLLQRGVAGGGCTASDRTGQPGRRRRGNPERAVSRWATRSRASSSSVWASWQSGLRDRAAHATRPHARPEELMAEARGEMPRPTTPTDRRGARRLRRRAGGGGRAGRQVASGGDSRTRRSPLGEGAPCCPVSLVARLARRPSQAGREGRRRRCRRGRRPTCGRAARHPRCGRRGRTPWRRWRGPSARGSRCSSPRCRRRGP